METIVKPIFLFADSQLLFWHSEEGLLLDRVRQVLSVELEDGPLKAAYLGASNGDVHEFYDLFVAAMEGIGIADCRMIPAMPSVEDETYLSTANVILLAGGDPWRGWQVFKENGFIERLIERYYAGAVLIGISAGAMQLGLKGWSEHPHLPHRTFDTLKIVPYVIDAHQEPSWSILRQAVREMGEGVRGLGIPMGGGVIFHPDWSIEPVRHSLIEFMLVDSQIQQTLLLPPPVIGLEAGA
ncbi:MAG TPA: Type 1 glutamine amidotransferase-like domain-containing protein [Herpetosiphonaceae bacterium]